MEPVRETTPGRIESLLEQLAGGGNLIFGEMHKDEALAEVNWEAGGDIWNQRGNDPTLAAGPLNGISLIETGHCRLQVSEAGIYLAHLVISLYVSQVGIVSFTFGIDSGDDVPTPETSTIHRLSLPVESEYLNFSATGLLLLTANQAVQPLVRRDFGGVYSIYYDTLSLSLVRLGEVPT